MKRYLVALALLTAASGLAAPVEHPHLLLTRRDVVELKASLGQFPAFDAEVRAAREQVDRALRAPIDVPVPKDAAGYTHERHKRNYVEMQLAGLLYQLTGEMRYATFVKEILLRYAALYPQLGDHPAGRSSAPGRLFHQTLNEAVWLVNTTQAYDCIYETLTENERTRIESGVLRPMAKFFSEDRLNEFDRIHNHGTWAATAVGMAGYVMGDPALVRKALYGSKGDGSAGYFRQMDELFSPDGYYGEGPYYARYALMPFYLFAQVIQNNDPAVGVFARRDQILKKALYALLQQTSPTGEFLPFNDAIKDKDLRSEDVVFETDAAFARYGRDPQLLSIARRQGAVVLGAAGLEVAKALATTPNPPPFPFASCEFLDGADGREGGVAVLRSGPASDPSIAVLKYTSFGMEHGHYDKLGFIYYDQGREIIPDYGSARFLNVEQKDGGRYLRENATYAKQTIAHNTVTVDGRSNYGGSYQQAEKEHGERQCFDARDPDFQVVSAVDRTAYPGVIMQRTLAAVRDERLPYPVVVDVYRLASAQPHRYDYALYYEGQHLGTNVRLTAHSKERPVFGDGAGYQHLWVSADAPVTRGVQFTWLNGGRYYSVTTSPASADHVYFVEAGANDPDFNLRHETAMVLRAERATAHVFASVIEPHGRWDGVKEQTAGGESNLSEVTVLSATDEATIVRIKGTGALSWTLMIANAASSAGAAHRVTVGTETFAWEGPAAWRRN